jgi:Sigma-70, region 4
MWNEGETGMEEAEFAAAVAEILDAMPDGDRRILHFRLWEGLEMRAIERGTNLSEHTVRRHLVRAMKALDAGLAARGWDHVRLRQHLSRLLYAEERPHAASPRERHQTGGAQVELTDGRAADAYRRWG